MGDSWWIKFGNKRSIHLLWLDHCVVFFDKIANWHCWNGGIYCARKKRNNRQKYTHVILKKKNPICLWIKVESPSPSFTKKDTIAVGCFIGFSKSSVSHTFIENSLNSTFKMCDYHSFLSVLQILQAKLPLMWKSQAHLVE